jgi:hypothetical protein
MEQLNRLKNKLLELKTRGITLGHVSANFLHGLTQGSTIALNSALTTSDVGFAASQAIEPVFRDTIVPASKAIVEPAFEKSVLASMELDEMGLLAPSVAMGVYAENPVLGSLISADVASQTNATFNPDTGFLKVDLPPTRKLQSLEFLRGGNISRRKLLRKRRVSRNRK